MASAGFSHGLPFALYVRMKTIKYTICGMSLAITIYSTASTTQAGSTSCASERRAVLILGKKKAASANPAAQIYMSAERGPASTRVRSGQQIPENPITN